MNNPKRKKPRAHLPSLSSAALKVFKAQLDAMPDVSQSAKETVMQSMVVAANPAAESPDAVIASLEPADRDAVRLAAQGYAQTLGNVGARGRNALMLDFEIDSMIDSQGDE